MVIGWAAISAPTSCATTWDSTDDQRSSLSALWRVGISALASRVHAQMPRLWNCLEEMMTNPKASETVALPRTAEEERARIVALMRREADVEPDPTLSFTHQQLLAVVRRLADQIAGSKGLSVEPFDSAGTES